MIAKIKMSEFFLELFTEEMPPNLQFKAKESILFQFKSLFEEKNINYNKEIKVFSTPNRLVVFFKNLNREILIESEEIRGPKTSAPNEALEGFIKSKKIDKKNIYTKNTEKGDFYFYKKPSTKVKTEDILNDKIPIILGKVSWKKSMRWGEFNLNWGRPLKSILAIYDGKKI